jgi:hypothetical protein
MASVAADKLTSRLHLLLGKEKTASGHLLHSAHAFLVPVDYATTNVFKRLEETQKPAKNTSKNAFLRLLPSFAAFAEVLLHFVHTLPTASAHLRRVGPNLARGRGC